MIRVAFLVTFSDRLLGQLNYFRNLFEALSCLENRKIEPVVFTGNAIDDELLKNFPSLLIVKTSILNRKSFSWFVHNILKRFLPKDIILEQLLFKYNAPVLSHSGTLGKNSPIKTIAWIPDFQHRHLPELFSKIELNYRNQMHEKYCSESNCLVVSSHDAFKDLKKFHPTCVSKTKILHFVAGPIANINLPDIQNLEAKYKFTGPFFHLPNQFWIHKNHIVVIEALKILREKKLKIIVVATGKTKDHRQPNLYNSLMKKIQEYNLSSSFFSLGVVPYNDLIALMQHSIALINPSLFEGWSSTVEEAKSIGKKIILSDIPIHREQNPSGGLFFNPHDPEMLALQMEKVVNSSSDAERTLKIEASKNLLQRKRTFASAYQQIVLDTFKNNHP